MVEVIPLAPEHWQRYRDIRLEALKVEPAAFSSTFEETSRRSPEYWQGRLADASPGGKSWLLFAQVEGRLVGMIGAVLDEESETAEIISVYVSPGWRGQGVGQALMETILNSIRQRPQIQRVILGVNSKQRAAVALYRRFGFQVTGEEDDDMGDGKTYTGYQMEKRLD